MSKLKENAFKPEKRDGKFVAKVSGVCPKCGSEEVEYGDFTFEGTACFYEVVCAECELDFREWYELDFIESVETI